MPTPPITSPDQLDPDGTYSYADYLTWQFEGWEEIVNGRLLAAPTYDEPHQRTVGALAVRLAPAARAAGARYRLRTSVALAAGSPAGAAPADFVSVVIPDLCVVAVSAPHDAQGYLSAPAWVIEVTAAGSATRDWRTKFDLYEENGVGEYWIVEPVARTIAVFVLDAATARYQSVGDFAEAGPVPCATLPGWGLDWADIFADD